MLTDKPSWKNNPITGFFCVKWHFFFLIRKHEFCHNERRRWPSVAFLHTSMAVAAENVVNTNDVRLLNVNTNLSLELLISWPPFYFPLGLHISVFWWLMTQISEDNSHNRIKYNLNMNTELPSRFLISQFRLGCFSVSISSMTVPDCFRQQL